MGEFIKKTYGHVQLVISISLLPIIVVLVLIGFTAGLLYGAVRAGFQDGSL